MTNDADTTGRRSVLRRAGAALSATLTAGIAGCQENLPVETYHRTSPPTVTPHTLTPEQTKKMPPFDASKSDQHPDKQVQRLEHLVFKEANDERRWLQIDPVRYDSNLAYVARRHSRDMVRRDYFAHDNPEGEDAWDRIKNWNLHYEAVGENIQTLAWTQGDTVDSLAGDIIENFMESKPHRKIILTERYGYLGVGIYLNEHATGAVTMLFGDMES